MKIHLVLLLMLIFFIHEKYCKETKSKPKKQRDKTSKAQTKRKPKVESVPIEEDEEVSDREAKSVVKSAALEVQKTVDVLRKQVKIMEKFIKNGKDWSFHSYAEMLWFMYYYNSSCNSMSYLYSIGPSVQYRDLWVMAFGKKPSVHTPGVPEVKLIGNIHGNEIIGREMLLYLIRYICDDSNRDSELHRLLQKIRLHVLPSLNPDGAEMAYKKKDKDRYTGRLNSNGVDINRNFPDQFFPSTTELEPETTAVISWLNTTPFQLSASFHDGALVVSYPYDDSPSGQTKYSATPDDDIFRKIAISYSEKNINMHQGKYENCTSSLQRKRFIGGISNGAEWSSITNTMQDYNYVQANCMEITVHLSCRKSFDPAHTEEIFQENLDSIKSFLSHSLKGIRGFVFDEHGEPIHGASISVGDRKHDVMTWKGGDYYRLLAPGTYDISASAKGFTSEDKRVTIDSDEAKILNFTLTKRSPDFSLLTLGHVNMVNKISNIVSFESDGRDSDVFVSNEETERPNQSLFVEPQREDSLDERIIMALKERQEINQKKLFNLSGQIKESSRSFPFNSSDYTNKPVSKALEVVIKEPGTTNFRPAKSHFKIGANVTCTLTKNSKKVVGILKWQGIIKEMVKKYGEEAPMIAGVQMSEPDPLGTDGTFLNVRYFKTEPGFAYFVPINTCQLTQES